MVKLGHCYKNRRIGDQKRRKSLYDRSRITAFLLLALFTFNVSVASATFEDFTTYTEVDGGNDITITSSKVEWTDLTRTATYYVYKDKGDDHFDGDYLFQYTWKVSDTSGGNSLTSHVVVSNTANDLKYFGDNNVSSMGAYITSDDLWVWERDGANWYDERHDISVGTTYYLDLERDESIGTYGTLYLRAYSDLARTNLLWTLSQVLHSSKKDFKYLLVLQGYNDGLSGREETGYIENLDLNEEEMATDTKILIENASTDASFYLDQTVSYGDMLVIALLVVLIIGGLIKFILDLEIPKRMNFKR